MTYQPLIRGGVHLQAGERDCADRYTAIRTALTAEGATGDTVLDLGAAQGYFAQRLATEVDCRVTAVDDCPDLPAAASERITVIPERLDPAGLRLLPRHDWVLALSVLHHFAAWRRALDAVLACRRGAIVEIPHPGERWMRRAAARRELGTLHTAVIAIPGARHLGDFPRRGRDGTVHQRPMFLLPGRLRATTGTVFGGSGTCSRRLPQFGAGLERHLGYTPYPGSLNLRTEPPLDLGPPAVDWVGRRGSRTRDYQFWPAWISDGVQGGLACHAMVPGPRGHGPDSIEVVAPVRLRDELGLADGDTVALDVEVTGHGAGIGGLGGDHGSRTARRAGTRPARGTRPRR